ncbi:MAG: hypothetical protein M1816_005917 [Peltula sp. TS41687]|nr:MAG: hypothetical protein M1816_005917 [Peltula sp. TS41687]
MVPCQSQSLRDLREARRQASIPTDHAKHPQGITKQRPPITPRSRRSRLKQIQYLAGQTASRDSTIHLPSPLPTSRRLSSVKISQDTSAPSRDSISGLNRKRSRRSSRQFDQRDVDNISQNQGDIGDQYLVNQGNRRQVIKPIRSPVLDNTGGTFPQQRTEDPKVQPWSRVPKQTQVSGANSTGSKNRRYPPLPKSSPNGDRELEDATGIGDSLRPPSNTSSSATDISGQEVLEKPSEGKDGRINHWVRKRRWPKQDFKQDSQIGEGRGQDGWFQRIKAKERSKKDSVQMGWPLMRKKSAASLRQIACDAGSVAPSSTTPSDEKPRELKSAPYRQAGYTTLLETQDSFLRESALGIDDKSQIDCQSLLELAQSVPLASLFGNDVFSNTMQTIEGRNEARVIKDISPLIVPSAENLATLGHRHLDILVENVNEGWNESIPLTSPRPQPDYSVGFRRSAFTDAQLKKLQPHIGAIFFGGTTDASYFVATWRCYFPFLTCEVKCGAGELDVADRQNAHSMTLAVRGIVELLRLVGREKEVHRQILAFSVSHDEKNVRIYGHYPVIDGEKTSFYRHSIREFVITDQAGKEKWAAYKFVRNVYDVFMPKLHKRICDAIDAIEPLAAEPIQGSLAASTPHTGNESSQEMTANGTPTRGSFKKPRLPPKVMLQQEIERLGEQLGQRDDQHRLQMDQLRQQMDYLLEQLKQRDEQLKQRDEQLKLRDDQHRQQMDRLIDLLKHQGPPRSRRQSLHDLEPDISQGLDAPLSQQSNAESISVLAGDIGLASSEDTTPNTSFTHQGGSQRRLGKQKKKLGPQSKR